ncbi:hypothetical protein EVJ58_g5942 [Rhodofomes roseus]|uniref:Uncharacterized protein n=1 Tax=Rhodofomes roseus TaxID=34475 RepID=A0A4Y9Y9D0_9APHY|nr:hypothetical protein EVJ58_g5942 [Rhodofomes roseus]
MNSNSWRLPTVDTPDVERNDLLPRFRPTRRLMTDEEFDEIAECDPLTILPWILVPDGLGDLAPPVMLFGFDIDPDMLIAYAKEHDVTVYFDETPPCSDIEFGESDDENDQLEQGVRVDQLGPSERGETQAERGSGQDMKQLESEEKDENDPVHDGDSGVDDEVEDDEDDYDYDFRRIRKSGPGTERLEIDRIGTMRIALHTLAKEKGARIPAHLLQIGSGVQRSAMRDTSLIAVFYTNYDLKADDLPTTDDIEKLRAEAGSQHSPGWYLDDDNMIWGRRRYY